jgi:hypothetical protein
MSFRKSLTCVGLLFLVLGPATDSSAQQRPDFSGIWVSDTSRSENPDGSMRVIKQTADAFDMVIFSRQTAYVQEITINPWKYRFGRFGPRRGGEDSSEPQTQVRWEGNSLVALKALGEYSVVWFFTLVSPNEMVIESLGHGISPSFDFRRSSLPRGYVLSKSVYTRAPISFDCGSCEFAIEAEGFTLATPHSGAVTFRLPNASSVVVTCREKSCQVKNNHDAHPPLTLSRGETTRLSILAEDGQWEIPAGAP